MIIYRRKIQELKKNINYKEYLKLLLLFINKVRIATGDLICELTNKVISGVTLTLITKATGTYYYQYSPYY